MTHIAIIGECMIELNGQPFGEMQQTFGGDTLNTALYLRRSCEAHSPQENITVSYVSALGEDLISKGMIERFEQEGISTQMVLRDPHRSPGVYLIQLDPEGERTFLYWRNQSAARYLLQHHDFERIEASLKDVNMVFISGISLAILPKKDRDKLLFLLGKLKQKGVKIAFDSNFRTALWPRDENATVKEIYNAMYALTDLALLTFDDEKILWNDASPQETLTRLATLGVKKAVIKLGSMGCLAQDIENKSIPHAVPTQPVKYVLDTTSAGDAFNGGFLSAYLAGEDLIQSCQRGNALAGIVIQHRGAIIPKKFTQQVINVV